MLAIATIKVRFKLKANCRMNFAWKLSGIVVALNASAQTNKTNTLYSKEESCRLCNRTDFSLCISL